MCKGWYPLDFNLGGYVIMRPQHTRLLYAFLINGSMASFYRDVVLNALCAAVKNS